MHHAVTFRLSKLPLDHFSVFTRILKRLKPVLLRTLTILARFHGVFELVKLAVQIVRVNILCALRRRRRALALTLTVLLHYLRKFFSQVSRLRPVLDLYVFVGILLHDIKHIVSV